MNKGELIEVIMSKSKHLNTRAAASEALDVMLESIVEAVKPPKRLKKGEKLPELQLVGFGTFKLKQKAKRKGRNPKTNESIMIPASNTVSFKLGKKFKQSVQ